MSNELRTHTYEEIRSTVVEILLGRDVPSQYLSLEEKLKVTYHRRETAPGGGNVPWQSSLSYQDRELLREVFWDLFRQGIITLGLNASNAEYPWFSVTQRGRNLLVNQEPYFFHDVSTYESIIRKEVPDIDPVTLLYLQEAMQAYMSGCVLSATVMIGVATEHSFNLLLETIDANANERSKFTKAIKERTVARRLEAFQKSIDGQRGSLPKGVVDGLTINLTATIDLIRNFRNDSGHPSGQIISREQCFMLLHLFIPCCKKIYELRRHYTAPAA